jgi:CheY-like chemotaxis protein
MRWTEQYRERGKLSSSLGNQDRVRSARGSGTRRLREIRRARIEADNGAEALALLKTRDCDFDLLITDYAMPHLSGTDLLREARQLCPGMPALLITGYAETEIISDRPQGVEMLLKPFTPAVFEAAIGRACGAATVAS